MKAKIRDVDALRVVTPAALSAWARAAGWSRVESHGDHSDIYAAPDKPEIILPRTQRLGDYASAVSEIIGIFAASEERDELSLYRDLVTADRDVVRIRAADGEDGSISVDAGVDLVRGARDLVLAAACSLRGKPQRLYRAAANQEAVALLGRVRLGQTEQGSFVVTLLTAPIVPQTRPPSLFPEDEPDEASDERKMTRRLAEAVTAAQQAAENAVSGRCDAFEETVENGVSANLCDALAVLIEPFPTLDIGVHWALTHPVNAPRQTVRFAKADAPILREAASSFRAREPKLDTRLFGFVHRLQRHEEEDDGTIYLRTEIDNQTCSVAVVLNQSDYHTAIRAHEDKAPVLLQGDLDRIGQRWRLLNPEILSVIPPHEDEEE
ncbi:MAG: hypothetical protein F4Y03_05680 [Alphaproteobacteria bacterium]|nr:hypothetical protein [Alphaproteobacteria bacterium]